MSPARLLLLVVALGAAGLIAAVALLGTQGDRDIRTSLAVSEALSTDTFGYARAVKGRPLQFPVDHGPHSDYRIEWWYYTGNLESESGLRFGYQLTIFRTALHPDTSATPFGDSTNRLDSTFAETQRSTVNGQPSTGPSTIDGQPSTGPSTIDRQPSTVTDWKTRQLYMAHFALSDVEAGEFFAYERFSRGAAGLAGAQTEPFRLWLEDWSVSGPDADSIHLVAETGEAAVDLILTREKPIVLHGEEGLDQKGPELGNASYYYSMTRLRTSGTATVRGETYAVEGLSWMDHEWSTSALGEDLVGWDWFSLQLDSGREIMYYRLRETGGGASPFSGGVIVMEDGAQIRLDEEDVVINPTEYWTSPETGNRYPVEWVFRIPSRNVDLQIQAMLREQELAHSVTYWEGAVRIEGSDEGYGFAELTGYGESEGGFASR